jgi:hypothetical protein
VIRAFAAGPARLAQDTRATGAPLPRGLRTIFFMNTAASNPLEELISLAEEE